jgi:CRISPR-associated protein (TIGR02584 family)
MEPRDASAPSSPGEFLARRVLLLVTGLTPQVVTETLYSLAQENAESLPHEVHVVTTAEGARRVNLSLLSGDPGWFTRLIRDYSLPPIAFGPENVHVLQDERGVPMSDIRTGEDNRAAADQIAELVRRFTADAGTTLHVSLSGGRKTLGFFAGYALSLWGRERDRLTHVLVTEPFESSWNFFYPTPYEHVIAAHDGQLADCRTAVVTLADLPFVRLRHGLPEELLSSPGGFANAVDAAQARLGPPVLRISFATRSVEAAGVSFALAPAELATLAWFARRAAAGQDALECPSDGVPSLDHANQYLAEYRRIRGVIDDDGRTAARYRRGMSKADFEERKSKLKRALREALGSRADPYQVIGEGRRPMRFRLALPAGAIHFEDERAPSPALPDLQSAAELLSRPSSRG